MILAIRKGGKFFCSIVNSSTRDFVSLRDCSSQSGTTTIG
nr:MAG TPA: Prokaryotic metallothionein [Caudoviricetes sp.]